MTVIEARNLAASLVGAGASIRPTSARPAESRPACQNGPSGAASGVAFAPECNTAPRRIDRDRAEQGSVVCPDSQARASNPRHMVAVTIALSEPAGSPELDWAETLAALVRLTFADTSVEVIDSWRVDQ